MPIPSLKPDGELLVSATAIALVVAIFANNMPPLADVRADAKGNVNTHKALKMAGITATAAVGSLALLGKSPTVATVGFGTILWEMWKNHFANYGADGTADNAASPTYTNG